VSFILKETTISFLLLTMYTHYRNTYQQGS